MYGNTYIPGFFNTDITDIPDNSLMWEGYPMHWRKFGSIPRH